MTRGKSGKVVKELSLQKELIKLTKIIQEIDSKNLFRKNPAEQFPEIKEQYNKVCPEKMWTLEMKAKACRGEYTSFENWFADFQLMIKNCLTFNANQPVYSTEAQRIYQEAIVHIQVVQDKIGEPSVKEATTSVADSPDQKSTKKLAGSAKKAVARSPTTQVSKKKILSDTLHDFLSRCDVEMKTRFTHSSCQSSFAQFNRRYSIKMILCLFYADATSKPKPKGNTKLALESIIENFDKLTDGLLFYQGERDVFIARFCEGAKDHESIKWHEEVGIDFLLRYALHFPAILSSSRWTMEEKRRNSEILDEVLHFVEKFFSEISEENSRNVESTKVC